MRLPEVNLWSCYFLYIAAHSLGHSSAFYDSYFRCRVLQNFSFGDLQSCVTVEHIK